MNCFVPDELVVERGSESSSVFNNLCSTLPQVPVRIVDDVRVTAAHDGLLIISARQKRNSFLLGTRASSLKSAPVARGRFAATILLSTLRATARWIAVTVICKIICRIMLR